MRAQQQKLPAPRQPTTQLSSLESAPFNSIGPKFRPIPFALRPEPQISPGGDRSVRVLTALTREFRPVAAHRGKPKTVAIAAFLGESGPLSTERWQLLRECHKLGSTSALLPAPKVRISGPDKAGFSTPQTFARQTIFRPIRIDVFKRPPPFCGWPPGASRPARHRVDHRMAQALLLGDQLHQLVGAFDIRRAVLQRARGRSRTRQALRRRRIFFERHKIARRRAKLDAEIKHEIIDRARLLDIRMHRLLRGAHAVFGDAAIIAGKQHRPFCERHENRNRARAI